MHIFKSIVDEKILQDFSEAHGRSLMNHVSNSYSIEMAIGFAGLFCPEVIEVEDCIFIAEFYNGGIESLKEQFCSRQKIEQFVNSSLLASLLKDFEQLDYTKNYIDEFAKALQYFWQLRFDALFPDKHIAVEIGENLVGEEGLSVTVYQKDTD